MFRPIPLLAALLAGSPSFAAPTPQGLPPAAPAARQPLRIHVDPASPGPQTGRTWHEAFHDIPAALAVAPSGSQVWVREGTYVPTAPAPGLEPTFAVPAGVALYGGFAGNETSLDQRDPLAHPTILSADVAGDDVYDPNPGTFYLGSDNVAHIVTIQGGARPTRIDGFTLVGALGGPGGCILAQGGTVEVARCKLEWTSCLEGGGLLATAGAQVTLEDCEFADNWLWNNSLGGGALMVDGGSSVVATNCQFLRAYGTTTLAGALLGISVHVRENSDFQALGCTFADNVGLPTSQWAGTMGGAIYLETGAVIARSCTFSGNHASFAGGAITNDSGTLTLEDCLFEHNAGPSYGGALRNGNFYGPGGATALVDRCTFHSNVAWQGGAIQQYSTAVGLEVRNCVFTANAAIGDGGAVYSQGGSLLIGCTIYGNDAGDHYGGVFGTKDLNGQPLDSVIDSILWANTDPFGGIGRSNVKGADVSYCCVENLFIGPPGEDPPDPANFPGSIDLDPMFVDAPMLDLHLQPSSPCVDAGDVLPWDPTVLTDRDGNPRFVDRSDVPDTGNGPPPLPDMGAYEVGP